MEVFGKPRKIVVDELKERAVRAVKTVTVLIRDNSWQCEEAGIKLAVAN
ncbi:MAG: hypothetical protein QF613_00025 [Candidatus Marinimicrobia bacterium]|nr:hypothetical protein [Candidatus Neomarinimicrobiota bacterium]MDP6592586.1 hypothetical protein [Candidatus Neomarinimicrobiota bacterium]